MGGRRKWGNGATRRASRAAGLSEIRIAPRVGVAPLFVPRDEGDTLYLLTNSSGGPLDTRSFDLAGLMFD